jgi:GGDEF domain-containing protein
MTEPGSTVSVSLGVATLAPRFDITPTYLVELADRGLYLASQNGCNQLGIAQAGQKRCSSTRLYSALIRGFLFIVLLWRS